MYGKRWYVLVLLAAMLLAACSSADSTAQPTPEGRVLNPVFQSCYRPAYGPVLSDSIQLRPQQTVQFTTGAVLLFDLQHPPVDGKPCLLSAVVTLQLVEPPAPPEPQALYVKGHNVHPLLQDAYLENQEEWGDPIAESFVDEFTLVQYFANLGVRLNLKGGKRTLLPYGAWLLARMDSGDYDRMTIGSFPVPEQVRMLRPL
ncbi:MAG: hypothetical protein Q9M13_03445, partial [Mariprofundales bacterium]|nr:hypothetical protein [Mariprofundales bacterium]